MFDGTPVNPPPKLQVIITSGVVKGQKGISQVAKEL
jgi:hypothetical protein